MKEISRTLKYKDKELKLVFNLNVMEAIQDAYGTVGKWGELTDGDHGEVNIKALIFGFKEMLNEGIEIDNEENGTDKPLFTSKQVGRMISNIGVENTTESIQGVVIDSTKDDSGKNA